MEGKAFRGESGQVVRDFLSAGTVLTAMPVGLATILLAVLAGFVQERFQLPPAVAVPAFLTLLAPVTGLFAMAARAGKTDAGFLESLAGPGGQGTAGFTLRYGALQVAWSVPLVLTIEHAAPRVATAILSGPGMPFVMAVWGAIALVGACLTLPMLTLLVATRTDSLGEALSGGAWRWLLSERRADIAPCVAAALGGMTLFVLASLPVLAFLLPLATDISPRLAQAMLFAMPALPMATTPILMGRLAGAFVAAEPIAAGPDAVEAAGPRPRPSQGPRTFDIPVPSPNRTVAGLASIPRPATLPRTDTPTAVQAGRGTLSALPLGVAVARAHQLAETDAEAALGELQVLRAANPRNPAVAAELARVLKKAARDEEALATAAEAIRLALAGGAGPIAHDVFRAFAAEAAQLNLEPAAYEQLGRILTARREYDGASWCYRAAAALGGDPKTLQKGLLAVAETAMEHGQFEKAAGVYQSFAATWPESPLASFATASADDAARKAHLAAPHR